MKAVIKSVFHIWTCARLHKDKVFSVYEYSNMDYNWQQTGMYYKQKAIYILDE